ncbi:hypothetical protein [Pseudomonas sp. NPDC089401]
MKMIALIALLATAGLAQAAPNDWPNCPEGTYPTQAGFCQPDWDFD